MRRWVRELALCNLGVDSKLRGCDAVALRVRGVRHGDQVATRAVVLQHKMQRPSGTRQYARILGHWVDEVGLDRADYGTHSMRRTKATLVYRRTKNLRAVQLRLGRFKLESTVRYLWLALSACCVTQS